jgi:hypothetical protein
MKIKLFDAEDIKEVEDAVFRGMVRALRRAAKEHLIEGWGDSAVAKAALAPAPPAQGVPAPPLAAVAPAPPEAPAAPPAPKKPPRRSLVKIIETVAHRPSGWIDRSEAQDLLGRNNAAESALSQWIVNKEVPACIVANAKPPHKGLPGRVHVDKVKLIERNERRLANAESPSYAWRRKEREPQQASS